MDILNELYKSMIYVTQSDFFYQAMAAVTIIAMFVGAMIYDGDLNQLKKAILTIFTYGGMISLTNISRIMSSPLGFKHPLMSHGQALNGTSTVIYVTFFYLLGLALGVFAHKQARKG